VLGFAVAKMPFRADVYAATRTLSIFDVVHRSDMQTWLTSLFGMPSCGDRPRACLRMLRWFACVKAEVVPVQAWWTSASRDSLFQTIAGGVRPRHTRGLVDRIVAWETATDLFLPFDLKRLMLECEGVFDVFVLNRLLTRPPPLPLFRPWLWTESVCFSNAVGGDSEGMLTLPLSEQAGFMCALNDACCRSGWGGDGPSSQFLGQAHVVQGGLALCQLHDGVVYIAVHGELRGTVWKVMQSKNVLNIECLFPVLDSSVSGVLELVLSQSTLSFHHER
jgi:hypothetical protein